MTKFAKYLADLSGWKFYPNEIESLANRLGGLKDPKTGDYYTPGFEKDFFGNSTPLGYKLVFPLNPDSLEPKINISMGLDPVTGNSRMIDIDWKQAALYINQNTEPALTLAKPEIATTAIQPAAVSTPETLTVKGAEQAQSLSPNVPLVFGGVAATATILFVSFYVTYFGKEIFNNLWANRPPKKTRVKLVQPILPPAAIPAKKEEPPAKIIDNRRLLPPKITLAEKKWLASRDDAEAERKRIEFEEFWKKMPHPKG